MKKFSSNYLSGINSFVGDATILRGEFEINGPLRIDGKFKGRVVSTGMVYIGRKSISECTIIAKDVVIGGTIKGDVYAEKSLSALKTAEIMGNIYSTSVNMEDGVVFDGECRILTKERMRELIEEKIKETTKYSD